MNKTTLEGLEKALERLEHIDGVYSWGDLLCEVREALTESVKREWVELTDDEIGAVMDFGYATDSELENAHAVIAAFKEKNQ